jgi:hypothetical protein
MLGGLVGLAVAAFQTDVWLGVAYLSVLTVTAGAALATRSEG